MTQILIPWAAIALFAASLSACATPTYPVRAVTTRRPRPSSRNTRSERRARLPPTTARPRLKARPAGRRSRAARRPRPPVVSNQGPAAERRPRGAPSQSPAQSALPPDYVPPRPPPTPPPPPPAAVSEPARAAPAPPAYPPPPEPPPPRRRPPRLAPRAAVVTDGKVVAATGMFRDYEVQKHDHLDAIARDLGTTRKVLVDANHLKAPYGLQPGQHLQVPVAKAYVAQGRATP